MGKGMAAMSTKEVVMRFVGGEWMGENGEKDVGDVKQDEKEMRF